MRLIRHDELKNGDVVYNHGHKFTVSQLRTITLDDGKKVIRYVGTCTEDEINNCIRRTSYNGGTYGARIDIPVAVETL